MFDDPFVFFALVIAIVALIFARKAMNQVAELRERLEAIEAAPAAAAAAVPPPLHAARSVRADPAAGLGRHRAGAAADRSRRRIHRTRRAARDGGASRKRRGAHRHRRCRSPTAASRKRSAPAGWCGSAG